MFLLSAFCFLLSLVTMRTSIFDHKEFHQMKRFVPKASLLLHVLCILSGPSLARANGSPGDFERSVRCVGKFVLRAKLLRPSHRVALTPTLLLWFLSSPTGDGFGKSALTLSQNEKLPSSLFWSFLRLALQQKKNDCSFSTAKQHTLTLFFSLQLAILEKIANQSNKDQS